MKHHNNTQKNIRKIYKQLEKMKLFIGHESICLQLSNLQMEKQKVLYSHFCNERQVQKKIKKIDQECINLSKMLLNMEGI